MIPLLLPVADVLLSNRADSLAGDRFLVALTTGQAFHQYEHAECQAVQNDHLASRVQSLDVIRSISYVSLDTDEDTLQVAETSRFVVHTCEVLLLQKHLAENEVGRSVDDAAQLVDIVRAVVRLECVNDGRAAADSGFESEPSLRMLFQECFNLFHVGRKQRLVSSGVKGCLARGRRICDKRLSSFEALLHDRERWLNASNELNHERNAFVFNDIYGLGHYEYALPITLSVRVVNDSSGTSLFLVTS